MTFLIFSACIFLIFLCLFAYFYPRHIKSKNRKKRQEAKERLLKEEEEARQWKLRKPAEVIATQAASTPAPRRGRQSLILLVEDSPTTLLALRKILERWEYRVITAEDGRDAWAQLQKTKPDLVVSDIDMPRLNGIELVKLMRNDIVYMHIPVILITGNTSYHLEAGREAGVNGLLSKPFEDRALVDQVRYILQE